MATVARENIGLLNDKITVKITKDEYFPSFEKKLKEYSKTANIPGFRKGMVPAGMIKKSCTAISVKRSRIFSHNRYR